MRDKTDADLIARFAAAGQEEAFEELVRRHGPMVQSVCRRVLGQQHDCEDTTQAVFVLLAQKALELTSRSSLAGWLHRVAWHTSLRARRAVLTRRHHERVAASWRQVHPAQECNGELQVELDGALNLLPDYYREPLVLHYLEGYSVEEAAQLMGCPVGTVASRLARGRDLLRGRLERWGLVLTIAAGGQLLLQGMAVEGLVSVSTASAATAMAASCTVPPSVTISAPMATSASTMMAAGGSASPGVGFMSLLKTRFAATLLGLSLCGSAAGGVAVYNTLQRIPSDPIQSKVAQKTATDSGSYMGGTSTSILPEPSSLCVVMASSLLMLLRRRC